MKRDDRVKCWRDARLFHLRWNNRRHCNWVTERIISSIERYVALSAQKEESRGEARV